MGSSDVVGYNVNEYLKYVLGVDAQVGTGKLFLLIFRHFISSAFLSFFFFLSHEHCLDKTTFEIER
jgi:hypothetical protein